MRKLNLRTLRPSRIRFAIEQLERRLLLAFTFVDHFDGTLSSNWEIPTFDGQGQVSLTSEHSLDQGGQSLLFQAQPTAPDDKVLNEAILHIDLSSAINPFLRFHQLEGQAGTAQGDINEPLEYSHVVEDPRWRPFEAYGDGLSISNDGVTWYRLLDLDEGDINRGGDGLWQLHEYDLAANVDRLNNPPEGSGLAPAALQLDSSVQLKFSQWGDGLFPRRGWSIDRLEITDHEPEFTTALEPNVFHRFGLAGESRDDFLYAVAVVGNVGPETPIIVGVHGADRSVENYTHRWLQLVTDPTAQLEGAILVAPWYRKDARYHGYNHLSWEHVNGRTADSALIDVLETIKASGIGNADAIKLFGFSGGGQFAQRFTMAHPEIVDAVVIGAPSSHAIPNFIDPYPYGLGENPAEQPPEGVELNPTGAFQVPTMFWVGQDDSFIPNVCKEGHPEENSALCDLDLSGPARSQGEGRLQRAHNNYERYFVESTKAGIARTDRLWEFMIGEGFGHGYDQSVRQQWMDFLFHSDQMHERRIEISSHVVTSASNSESSLQLPQHVNLLAPGQNFFVEIWGSVETAEGHGIATASFDVYFDNRFVTANAISSASVFNGADNAVIDQAAGRIRNINLSTTQSSLGVGEYQLIARIEFEAKEPTESHTQLSVALQRGNQTWELDNGTHIAPRMLPLSRTHISTVASTALFGRAWNENVRDGLIGPDEPALTNVPIVLKDMQGDIVMRAAGLEPDDFYHGTVVNQVLDTAVLSAQGPDVVGSAVTARDIGTASTGQRGLTFRRADTWFSRWQFGKGELKVEFPSGATQVAIDAVATASSQPRAGRMVAYDTNGNQIAEATSGQLANGQFERLVVSVSVPTIAYVVVGGINGEVRLDNLQFLTAAKTVTDNEGDYRLTGVPSGHFMLNSEPIVGKVFSLPQSGAYQFDTLDHGVIADLNFGYGEATLVEQVVLNDGDQHRSRVETVSVVFNEEVQIDSGAFRVVRRAEPLQEVTVLAEPTTVNGKTTVKLSFSGAQTRYGSLIDGNYELIVDGQKVTNLDGIPLDGDENGVSGGDLNFGDQEADQFFRLFGDQNGDRDVDFADFLRFRSSYGTGSGDNNYRTEFDFEGNGEITFVDFLAFRSRYGSHLEF